MARKKILFVIVEGPSDDAALGVILNRLYDKSKVHIEIMHGDITSDMSIDPNDIVSALGDVVKEYAVSMHFQQSHFQQVIHLVDMDGAYVPNSAIIENPDAEKPIYSLTEIQTARPDQLILRNEHKRSKLNRISKLKKVWVSIPYQAYYMSSNLDHVLYGKLNSSDTDKENDAYQFALKYKDDIDGFLTFISDSDFSKMDIVIKRHGILSRKICILLNALQIWVSASRKYVKNVGNRKKTKNKDLYEEQYRWSGNSSGIALLALWICKKPLNDESIKSFRYSAVSVFSGSSGVIRTISFGEQSRS